MAPLSFLEVVIPGYHNASEVYLSLSQDGGREYSNAISYFLLEKPVITRLTPSYHLIQPGKTYTIGVHGSNFDHRFLKCRLNDVIELKVKYLNNTYIECSWSNFEDQKRYIVSVSTNDG